MAPVQLSGHGVLMLVGFSNRSYACLVNGVNQQARPSLVLGASHFCLGSCPSQCPRGVGRPRAAAHLKRGEGGGLHKELQLTANVMLICMGSQSAMSFDGIALKALR